MSKRSKKKSNKILEKFDWTEIISAVLIILVLINYFSLSKIINMIFIFVVIMAVCLFFTYFLTLLFGKNKKKFENTNHLFGMNIIIHIGIAGIALGQLCMCGSHYFHIVPLIISTIIEVVFYHICIKNYKKKKDLKYVLIVFALLNVLYTGIFVLSRVNMTLIHAKMYEI